MTAYKHESILKHIQHGKGIWMRTFSMVIISLIGAGCGSDRKSDKQLLPLPNQPSTEFSEVNDLSTKHSVTVQGEFYVATDKEGKVNAHIRAAHDYTNTLECSAAVTLNLFQNGRIKLHHALVPNLLIYPSQAFGSPADVIIDLHLRPHETLDTGQKSEPIEMTCSGYDNRAPMPKEFCESPSHIKGHQTTCEMLTRLYGWGRYPVIINNAYLGYCDCAK